jgi:hypothetical protein
MTADNITLQELATITGFSVDKLRRLRKAGKIPSGWQANRFAPVIYSKTEPLKIQKMAKND